MSAYKKQRKLMQQLGIAKIARIETSGSTSVWDATLTSGNHFLVQTSRRATRISALESLARMVREIKEYFCVKL